MRTFPGCLLVLVGLGALTLVACDPALPSQAAPDPATCADSDLGNAAGFEATAKPLFETYCTWCHSTERSGEEDRKAAPPHANYDTYDYVAEAADITWARMADRTMPPMGRMPTTEEYQTILDWLSCAEAHRIEQGDPPDDDDSAS